MDAIAGSNDKYMRGKLCQLNECFNRENTNASSYHPWAQNPIGLGFLLIYIRILLLQQGLQIA